MVTLGVLGDTTLGVILAALGFALGIYLLDIPHLVVGVSEIRTSLAITLASYISATSPIVPEYSQIAVILAIAICLIYSLANLASRVPPAKARVRLRKQFENALQEWSKADPSIHSKRVVFLWRFKCDSRTSIWLLTLAWPVVSIFLGLMILLMGEAIFQPFEFATAIVLITVTISIIHWASRGRPERMLLEWDWAQETAYKRVLRVILSPLGGLYIALIPFALSLAIVAAQFTISIAEHATNLLVVISQPSLANAIIQVTMLVLAILAFWPPFCFPLYGIIKLFGVNVVHRKDPTVRVVPHYYHLLAYSSFVMSSFLVTRGDWFPSMTIWGFSIVGFIIVVCGAPFMAAWFVLFWLQRKKTPAWNRRLEQWTILALAYFMAILVTELPIEEIPRTIGAIAAFVFLWYGIGTYSSVPAHAEKRDRLKRLILPIALEGMVIYGWCFLSFSWTLLALGPALTLLILALPYGDSASAKRIMRIFGVFEEPMEPKPMS